MGWGLLPPPGDAAVAAEEAAAAAAAWMLMYLVAVDEAAVFGTTNAALAGVEVVNCNKLQHAYLLYYKSTLLERVFLQKTHIFSLRNKFIFSFI